MDGERDALRHGLSDRPWAPRAVSILFMEDAAYFVEFPFEDLHPSAELDRAKAVMKSDREGGWHLRIPRFSIVMEMPDDFRPWDAVHGS